MSQKDTIYNGMDWSFSVRGSQTREGIDAQSSQCQRYELAGSSAQELDGSASFQASAAQVAAWQAEANQTGRGFDQIMRYHLVLGVEVQGPDGLILIMIYHPYGHE
jgi:hypothetical protein